MHLIKKMLNLNKYCDIYLYYKFEEEQPGKTVKEIIYCK